MDLIITILPVVTKDLPISLRFTPYNFLSRCKFSTLTTRQPMFEFYLLTFPRFPLRKKEHKSYFGKNRTHDFRISRCAGYPLDHSGDEVTYYVAYFTIFCPNTILHHLSYIALYPYTVTKCFQDWSSSTFGGDRDQETVQITSSGWRAGITLDNFWGGGLEVVGGW